MSDISRVGDLQAGNGEHRVGGAQAEETHEHSTSLIGTPLQVFDFLKTDLSLHLIEFLIQGHICGHEVFSDLFLAGLIVIPVEMYSVPLDAQGKLFLVVLGQLTTVCNVFSGVITDPYIIRLTQLDRIGNELVDVVVV